MCNAKEHIHYHGFWPWLSVGLSTGRYLSGLGKATKGGLLTETGVTGSHDEPVSIEYDKLGREATVASDW
jgi:hypothetical protein